MALSTPHGGKLVDRILRGEEREAALRRARAAKKIPLSEVGISDFEMIANGAMSPLNGFMTKTDYDSVVQNMRLANGLVWSLPITLSVSKETAAEIRLSEEIALVENGNGGGILGVMQIAEKFEYDKTREAQEVYRTTETAHPGVARVMSQGEVCLAGEVWMINRPANVMFAAYRRDPAETRRLFAERGWNAVVGFQTRNRCIAPTSIFKNARWKSSMGCCCIRLLAKPKKTISRRICGWKAITRCCKIIIRPIACC